MAHAYDLVHILAKSIGKAGTTDRAAVRNALEEVKNYSGLIKDYKQPFTAARHEALGPEEVFMARYDEDGALARIEGIQSKP
jgi:branched-chain amino acid transport system substrate-binding protein